QLFEHPTIAALSEVAVQLDSANAVDLADQGAVTGPVPLTPIQRWFFDLNLKHPHHWNLSTMLEVWPRCDAKIMDQAVRHLVVHHDALRLRFFNDGDGWRQVNASPDDTQHFSVLDFSDVPDESLKEKIEHTAAELQTSLDLQRGPLFRVILMDFGEQRPSRLLI